MYGMQMKCMPDCSLWNEHVYFDCCEVLSPQRSHAPSSPFCMWKSPFDFEAFGVRLGLRVDRIDRLADGSLLIIDYKTGRPRNLLNKDGDPQDLQLVVYADALAASVGGLAIVNIDSRLISYKGTGGSVEWDAAPQDTWPQRLESWRDEVHQALREIAAGDVRVNLLLTADEARPLGILSRIEEMKRAH